MNLYSKKSLIERIRRGKQSRAKLVSSNLDKGIAFQIRATRARRDMTQGALAAASGMTQNNISRLEDETYGKHTLSSLKRIAEALDVALVVRFVPFSQFIDWLSGTPHLDKGLRPDALAVPNFEEEEFGGQYETNFKYFPVFSRLSDATPVAKGIYSSQVSAHVEDAKINSAIPMPVRGPYEPPRKVS